MFRMQNMFRNSKDLNYHMKLHAQKVPENAQYIFFNVTMCPNI